MQDAPFFTEMAQGPDDAQAFWLNTDDDVRIRVGLWRPAADVDTAGTVLLFPGRTKYIEKYGRTAADFAAAGLTTFAIDWRGQGLADRLSDDAMSGHVHKFTDYQRDVAAMVQAATELDLPKPWFLLGHSMGGGIGLRAVMNNLPVTAVTFSAPMWGIHISRPLRPVAWSLSWSSRNVGLGHLYAPGTSGDSYVMTEPFEVNKLTTDLDMYDYMRGHMRAQPDLALGGPSLRWLYEALNETRQLWRMPSPDLPCLTLLGDEEEIVDVSRIHDRMRRWPNGMLEVVDGARHEVLMETPKIRGWLTNRTIRFFLEAATRRSPSDVDGPDAGSATPSHPPAQGIA